MRITVRLLLLIVFLWTAASCQLMAQTEDLFGGQDPVDETDLFDGRSDSDSVGDRNENKLVDDPFSDEDPRSRRRNQSRVLTKAYVELNVREKQLSQEFDNDHPELKIVRQRLQRLRVELLKRMPNADFRRLRKIENQQAHARISRLYRQYLELKSEEDRKELLPEIEGALKEQFDLELESRENAIEQLEERIEKLKTDFGKRKDARERLTRHRLTDLELLADGQSNRSIRDLVSEIVGRSEDAPPSDGDPFAEPSDSADLFNVPGAGSPSDFNDATPGAAPPDRR